jgi:hypothetical protein
MTTTIEKIKTGESVVDPNSNLKEQLEKVQLILYGGPFTVDDYGAITARLAELIEALDGWLSKGGFLPGKWEHQARKARDLADAIAPEVES